MSSQTTPNRQHLIPIEASTGIDTLAKLNRVLQDYGRRPQDENRSWRRADRLYDNPLQRRDVSSIVTNAMADRYEKGKAPAWSNIDLVFVGSLCQTMMQRHRWLGDSEHNWVVGFVVKIAYNNKLGTNRRELRRMGQRSLGDEREHGKLIESFSQPMSKPSY